MKLGISMTLPHDSPENWAEKHRAEGLEAVVFPCDYKTPVKIIDRYVSAAADAGLCIAEVGAWSNPMSPDKIKRQNSITLCQR